jgi:hypothetical protein
VSCGSGERNKLERLCRYIGRPANANERLRLSRCGQVVVELKTPYRDGTTHIVMSPLELLQRLAALVPRPRLNLIRFHGVLAPNAKWRSQIVPGGQGQADDGAEPVEQGSVSSGAYMPWARLLKRVFGIDIEICPNCGGQLKLTAPAHPCARGISASMHVIAAITDPAVIRKILNHLGLSPHPPPRSPARYDPYWEADIY